MRSDNNANGNKADEQYLQELSALLDGELNSNDDVLYRATCEDQCRGSWQSYHLIRDVMQKEHHAALPNNFASLVSEKIALEDDISDATADVIPFADAKRSRTQTRQVQQRETHSAPTWLPFAGLGLAASVAAAGFIGWQVLGNSQSTGQAPADNTVAEAVVESPATPVTVASVDTGLVRTVYRGDSGTSWVPVSGERDAKVEQRLNSLLLNHLEDSNMARVQGLVAHTRVVGYDSELVNESF